MSIGDTREMVKLENALSVLTAKIRVYASDMMLQDFEIDKALIRSSKASDTFIMVFRNVGTIMFQPETALLHPALSEQIDYWLSVDRIEEVYKIDILGNFYDSSYKEKYLECYIERISFDKLREYASPPAPSEDLIESMREFFTVKRVYKLFNQRSVVTIEEDTDPGIKIPLEYTSVYFRTADYNSYIVKRRTGK